MSIKVNNTDVTQVKVNNQICKLMLVNGKGAFLAPYPKFGFESDALGYTDTQLCKWTFTLPVSDGNDSYIVGIPDAIELPKSVTASSNTYVDCKNVGFECRIENQGDEDVDVYISYNVGKCRRTYHNGTETVTETGRVYVDLYFKSNNFNWENTIDLRWEHWKDDGTKSVTTIESHTDFYLGARIYIGNSFKLNVVYDIYGFTSDEQFDFSEYMSDTIDTPALRKIYYSVNNPSYAASVGSYALKCAVYTLTPMQRN